MNVVLHRANLDEIDELVALAEDVGADRLELANTQYLNWALSNRDVLLPPASRSSAPPRGRCESERLAARWTCCS